MNVATALTKAELVLKRLPVARLEAEILLSHSRRRERAWLLSHSENKLSLWQFIRFFYLVWQRRRGHPIAHLTGQKDFFGRSFKVNKNVLIPRPETELLIDITLGTIRANSSITKVVEIGTGCGCIAVTLAVELPQLRLIATDISPAALKLAQQNAARHRVHNRLTFLRGNLLQPLLATGYPAPRGVLDPEPNVVQGSLLANTLLIANLPYLRSDEIKGELTAEPRAALDGGKDGLNLYRQLIWQLKSLPKNRRPPQMLLELHPPTAAAVMALINNSLPVKSCLIFNDASLQARVILATLA